MALRRTSMKYLIPILAVAVLSGCVSIGVQCTSGQVNGWVKVRRIGYGISKAQTENFAAFREKVCR